MGKSYRAEFYGIKNEDEAKNYLSHPVLGARLLEITNALLKLRENNPLKVMGSPDDLKLKSCMTLFAYISEEGSIFHQVLKKFFGGTQDEKTIRILESNKKFRKHSSKNLTLCFKLDVLKNFAAVKFLKDFL